MDRDRLGELFEQAIERPPEEREAFVERACGSDAGLLAELRSLLASHARAPDFLDRVGERVLPDALDVFAADDPWSGTRLGKYEIRRRLGAGGMGVVYEAYDGELHRPVALKFLPSSRTADDDARERLKREARAASALDHPNLAVVHEIGTAPPSPQAPHGGLYIAMAYYDGETVAEKIARGPLPLDEVLGYGVQLVDGLSRAHEAGIVHRDIKPANVIVTQRGDLKIVDFGIAQRTDARSEDPASGFGTVAYTSPEQLSGGRVDHRTDLWSTGVLLYEMCTGVRPFDTGGDRGVAARIREEEPRPLATLRADVPEKLARVVHRCLSKDPARRHASAATLLADLHSVSTASRSEIPSLLVLPFANMSADPENEFFSDGFTEEIITGLSHLRDIRVISRTSSMRLKGRPVDPDALARELGVTHVLEGSVRRAGDALRITARLVEVSGQEQLWSGTFDGVVADVFDMQERVAREVTDALRLRLTPGEARALTEHPVSDVKAYECYLRARFEAWSFSPEGLARARRHIEAAVALVGHNELLYGTLGHITAMHLEVGIDPDGTALEQVDDLVAKLFAIDPSSARGNWLRAWRGFQCGDLRTAIRYGKRALARDPDNPDTLMLLGYIYLHAGRNADARAVLERALQLDPLTPLTVGVQGFIPIVEGRYAEAVEPYRRCRELDPESPFAAVFYGWALAYDRRTEEAIDALDEAATRFSSTVFGSYARSFAHGLRGEREEAVRAITPEFEAAAEGSEMLARELAHCYALAGRKEDALKWLEREIELGMLNIPYLTEHDHLLDGIRGEPRFAELIEKARVTSEALEIDP